MWEETLSFTLHMAEVVLVRFLVWDHDPIGRDFIGQRTVAFTSLMPGLCSIIYFFSSEEKYLCICVRILIIIIHILPATLLESVETSLMQILFSLRIVLLFFRCHITDFFSFYAVPLALFWKRCTCPECHHLMAV